MATPAATNPAITPAAIDRLRVSVGTFFAARVARVRTARTALFASLVNACARLGVALLLVERLRGVARLAPAGLERPVVFLVAMIASP